MPTNEINGGCNRTRTCDPLIKSQLLYQLSYTPAASGSIGMKLAFRKAAGPRRRIFALFAEEPCSPCRRPKP